MTAARALLFAAVLASTHAVAGDAPVLVDVKQALPDAVLDLRYATEDNFLGRKVYPDGARCLLRPETVKRLKVAAQSLKKQGYRLRLYDCYRPRSVQWEMWAILPRPGYVADPRKGSNHNRGTAVDLTLADESGRELEMPTGFDSFEKAAHHGYAGASAAATKHRETLREAMEAAGFRKNRMEWWHYSIPGATKFPVLDEPLVEEPACFDAEALEELNRSAQAAQEAKELPRALHDFARIVEHSDPKSDLHQAALRAITRHAPERASSIPRRCAKK